MLSVALLVMALVLALPEVPRLVRLLVLERAVPAPARQPLFANPTYTRVAGVVGLLVLAVATVGHVRRFAGAEGTLGRASGALIGAYVVEAMTRGGAPVAPVLTDSSLWRGLVLDPARSPQAPATASVAFTRDTLSLAAVIDTAAGTITFRARRPQGRALRWTYTTPDADRLVLTGVGDLHRLVAPHGGRRAGGQQRGTSSGGAALAASGAVADAQAGAPSDSVRVVLRRVDLRKLPLLRPAPWFR